MKPVLTLKDLNISFGTRAGKLHAIRNFDLEVRERQTVALVGESGSGKSVTSLSLLGLLPSDMTQVSAAVMEIDGEDFRSPTSEQLRQMRGNTAAMIFQEPMTSLNPVLSVGTQLVEALEAHDIAHGRQAWERAVRLLELVKLPDARRRIHDYPHQMSGGMNQRVVIALAIACKPRLLIADEPTTALDVTIQAQIMRLLRDLRDEMGMGVLLITHDLALVAENADRVAVMYAGRKVEEGTTKQVLSTPKHPYTIGLLAATPKEEDTGRLNEIPGIVPSLTEMPRGCAFAPRCSRATELCSQIEPATTFSGDRMVACHHADILQ